MSSTLPIERTKHLSLDERLRSARAAGDDHGGWQAPLENVPSAVVVQYREGENGRVLEMSLEFASGDAESVELARATTPESEVVEVGFGKSSGRIYKVRMQGVQLTRNSAEHFADGMLHCLRRLRNEADLNKADPNKAATAQATVGLLKKVLAAQVEEIRRQMGKSES